MKLVLIFDYDVDIIDVPQFVIENKDALQKQFLKWLYNKQNKHNYWICTLDSRGRKFFGVRYRSDAFVEWLNKKILIGEKDKACIVSEHTNEHTADLPSLLF